MKLALVLEVVASAVVGTLSLVFLLPWVENFPQHRVQASVWYGLAAELLVKVCVVAGAFALVLHPFNRWALDSKPASAKRLTWIVFAVIGGYGLIGAVMLVAKAYR